MNTQKQLVVIISQGMDDERASVAWSIANGGINSGLDVSVFLVSSGVDWVRKGAKERAHLNPEDPTMGSMIQNVLDKGCAIGVCPPCIKVRGYAPEDLIAGVEVVGSGFIHERIKNGAATLNF